MHVIVIIPASFKRFKYKTNEKKLIHRFPHYKSIWVFLHSRTDNSLVSGAIWPKFELILDIMHVIVT